MHFLIPSLIFTYTTLALSAIVPDSNNAPTPLNFQKRASAPRIMFQLEVDNDITSLQAELNEAKLLLEAKLPDDHLLWYPITPKGTFKLDAPEYRHNFIIAWFYLRKQEGLRPILKRYKKENTGIVAHVALPTAEPASVPTSA